MRSGKGLEKMKRREREADEEVSGGNTQPYEREVLQEERWKRAGIG